MYGVQIKPYKEGSGLYESVPLFKEANQVQDFNNGETSDLMLLATATDYPFWNIEVETQKVGGVFTVSNVGLAAYTFSVTFLETNDFVFSRSADAFVNAAVNNNGQGVFDGTVKPMADYAVYVKMHKYGITKDKEFKILHTCSQLCICTGADKGTLTAQGIEVDEITYQFTAIDPFI
jgi:hypothetical protein